MAKLEEVEPLIRACLQNAERLVQSAKAVMGVPAGSHIAYHLAVLALEEIGKSTLIFQESLDPKPLPRDPESKQRSPMDWLEDHERKLFWAVWLPLFDANPDWRTIPECLEFAKEMHIKRLHIFILTFLMLSRRQRLMTRASLSAWPKYALIWKG